MRAVCTPAGCKLGGPLIPFSLFWGFLWKRMCCQLVVGQSESGRGRQTSRLKSFKPGLAVQLMRSVLASVTSSCALHQSPPRLASRGVALLERFLADGPSRWRDEAGHCHPARDASNEQSALGSSRWGRLTLSGQQHGARLPLPCPALLPPLSVRRCPPNIYPALLALTRHLLPGGLHVEGQYDEN